MTDEEKEKVQDAIKEINSVVKNKNRLTGMSEFAVLFQDLDAWLAGYVVDELAPHRIWNDSGCTF